MSVLATLILTLAGLALIAVALSDIFRTILHVEARGALAHATMAALWTACRRQGGRSVLVLAGPVGLLAVVAVWATLLLLGWSLILWPHIEDGFARPSESTAFWDAVHVSIASLTTLGFSDVVPEEEWLRVITPLEALLGFGLLSASIAYLLLIYPVLARRRSMAYELSLLRSAEDRGGPLLEQLEEAPAERLFAELMSRLVVIERDTADFPAAPTTSPSATSGSPSLLSLATSFISRALARVLTPRGRFVSGRSFCSMPSMPSPGRVRIASRTSRLNRRTTYSRPRGGSPGQRPRDRSSRPSLKRCARARLTSRRNSSENSSASEGAD